MEKLKITTISYVNTRSGPGMVYSKKDQYPINTTLVSIDAKKDANGVMWFKLDNSNWICGNYVTLAKEKQNIPISDTRVQWLQRFTQYDATTGEIIDNEETIIPDTENPDVGLTPGKTKIIQDTLDKYDKNSKKNKLIRDIINNVKENVTGVNDVWLGKRIFGTPYQFLPTTDRPRGRDGKTDQELGFTYYDALTESAVLSILPGNPMFLPDLNGEEKTRIFGVLEEYAEKMVNKAHDLSVPDTSPAEILQSDRMDVRYFTFNPNFTDYIRYVNTLCNALAVMYDIGDMKIDGMKDTLNKCNWAEYTMSMYYANRKSRISASTGLKEKAEGALGKASDALTAGVTKGWEAFLDAVGSVVSDMGLAPYYTDFYVDPRVSYSETFTNVTRESMMASMVKGASDMAKEISFLLDSGAVSAVGNSQENLLKELGKAAGELGNNGKGFFDRFFRGASTVLTGANIVFPEIWTDSKYTKNYSVEIHLKTPYGRKKSVFTDVIVPLMHLVALVAPRQNTVNTYASPFLVRCHIPGIFNVDLGIIESMTINKGGDGTCWNVEGLPTQVDVTLNIKDLYSSLSISRINSPTDAYNMLWNNELISYLGIQSGIDMKHSNFAKMCKIAYSLGLQAFEDIWERPYDKFTEGWASMFGSWAKK